MGWLTALRRSARQHLHLRAPAAPSRRAAGARHQNDAWHTTLEMASRYLQAMSEMQVNLSDRVSITGCAGPEHRAAQTSQFAGAAASKHEQRTGYSGLETRYEGREMHLLAPMRAGTAPKGELSPLMKSQPGLGRSPGTRIVSGLTRCTACSRPMGASCSVTSSGVV